MPLRFNNSIYYAYIIKTLEATSDGYEAKLISCDLSAIPDAIVSIPKQFENIFIQQFSNKLPILVRIKEQTESNPLCRTPEIIDIMVVSPFAV